jgi:hypothetical protein
MLDIVIWCRLADLNLFLFLRPKLFFKVARKRFNAYNVQTVVPGNEQPAWRMMIKS